MSTIISETRPSALAHPLLYGGPSTEHPMTLAAAIATVALSASSIGVFCLADRVLKAALA